MKDMPNSFWAAIFIFLAAVIAVVVLWSPGAENLKGSVITLASSIVAGSFGYIQGHKDGSNANPTPPVPPALPQK